MVFKNEKQLKSFLLQKCKPALERSQNQIYKIIDLYLNRFYADYDPVMYERTYKLLHSLVKSDIVSTVNGYKAEVYFNLNYLYDTGAQPSGKQVMDAAAYGGHGAKGLKIVNGGGEDAWFTPLEILNDEAVEILKSMLIAEGIPIK